MSWVSGEPYIREMANITATANERLTISCHVTGYPIAAVAWHRGTSHLGILDNSPPLVHLYLSHSGQFLP